MQGISRYYIHFIEILLISKTLFFTKTERREKIYTYFYYFFSKEIASFRRASNKGAARDEQQAVRDRRAIAPTKVHGGQRTRRQRDVR